MLTVVMVLVVWMVFMWGITYLFGGAARSYVSSQQPQVVQLSENKRR